MISFFGKYLFSPLWMRNPFLLFLVSELAYGINHTLKRRYVAIYKKYLASIQSFIRD